MQSRRLRRLKKKIKLTIRFLTYHCQIEHAITSTRDSRKYTELLHRDSTESQIKSPKYVSNVEITKGKH